MLDISGHGMEFMYGGQWVMGGPFVEAREGMKGQDGQHDGTLHRVDHGQFWRILITIGGTWSV